LLFFSIVQHSPSAQLSPTDGIEWSDIESSAEWQGLLEEGQPHTQGETFAMSACFEASHREGKNATHPDVGIDVDQRSVTLDITSIFFAAVS